MEIHFFRSISDVSVYALTSDKSGANLPMDLGPWEYPAGASMTDKFYRESVVQVVRRDGFHIVRGAIGVARIGPMPG
jgi:hypothetical protein